MLCCKGRYLNIKSHHHYLYYVSLNAQIRYDVVHNYRDYTWLSFNATGGNMKVERHILPKKNTSSPPKNFLLVHVGNHVVNHLLYVFLMNSDSASPRPRSSKKRTITYI